MREKMRAVPSRVYAMKKNRRSVEKKNSMLFCTEGGDVITSGVGTLRGKKGSTSKG